MKAKSKKGQATRQRILDAAVGLMSENGVKSTSVDDVLQASDTGKSQFYHYFGSKDLLVSEVINVQSEKSLRQKITSPTDLDVWMKSIVDQFEKGKYPNGSPIGTLANELANQHELHRKSLAVTFGEWEEELAASIKSMVARNQLGSDAQPESLAMFIVGSIEGALLLAKTERQSRALKATREHVMKYLKSFQPKAGASQKRSSVGFCP